MNGRCKMGEVIAFVSGKGGTGKSAICVLIGQALAQREKKVLLIDANTGLRTLDLYLGLENEVFHHLNDFVKGKCSLEEAMLMHKELSNLFFLPAAQTKETSSLTGEELKEKLGQIKDDFDFILIDAPTGVEHGMQLAAVCSDKAVIVSGQRGIDIRCSDKTCMVLDKIGIRERFLIFNKIGQEENSDALDFLSAELLGKIPEDSQVEQAMEEALVLKDGPAHGAIQNITGRLLGEEIPFLSFTKQKKLFARPLHLFGRRS